MSATSLTSEWYEDIEVFSSDYEPDTFEPGDSVETNHALLNGLRDNDFEITDSAYTVCFESCVACWLAACGLLVVDWLGIQVKSTLLRAWTWTSPAVFNVLCCLGNVSGTFSGSET